MLNDIRITILEDVAYEIIDHSMPLKAHHRMVVFKHDIPQQYYDKLVVLSVCDVGTNIENVGRRHGENVFYVRSE